nr:Cna B-type domain-containing protein [Lachnospiraceae bacterium]
TIDAKIGADGKLVKDVKYIRMLPDPQKPGEYIEDPLALPSTTAPAYEGKFVFENEYKASNFIDIEGEKHMKLKPLKTNDYWFVLKEWDDEGKNPTVLKEVTHGNAPLDKTTREAISKFEFSHLEKDANGNTNPNYVKEFNFTQEDLRAPDGKSYLDEITKHYTVEEFIKDTKKGVTTHGEVYFIEVTIKRDGTDKLVVEKSVFGKDGVKIEGNATSIPEFVQKLLGKTKGQNDKIVFKNDYYAECPVDPPILTKEIAGRNILPGEFKFKISGTPFVKMPNSGEKEYVEYVYNDAKGEIDVSDIILTIDDLDVQDDGTLSKEFVYIAEEVKEGEAVAGWSPAKFELRFTAYDKGDGTMYTVPPIAQDPHNPTEDEMKWKQLTPNGLEREADFVNTFKWNGAVDIKGIKRMKGRELKETDKYEFTITEVDKPENTYTVTNKMNKVDFLANEVVNSKGEHFLKYRYGAFELEPDKLTEIDDRGEHVYQIKEVEYTKNSEVGDTSIFLVHVDVKDQYKANGYPVTDTHGDGILEAKVISVDKISGNTKTEFEYADGNDFEFINEFKATGTLDLDGKKYLNDEQKNKIVSPDAYLNQYEFALHQYSDAARKTGKKLIDSKMCDKNGKFVMDTIKYDQEILKNAKGEYEDTKTLYYRLTEVKPASGKWSDDHTQFESEGVIYDLVEYDIDVVITYDGTENLKVQKIIKNSKNLATTVQPVLEDNQEYDVTFQNIIKEYTTIEGQKHWIDKETDPNNRLPVKINLYSSAVGNGNTIINTYTIVAPDVTYRFATDSAGNKLPVCDANGKAITYRVTEDPINGYISEQLGYDFYNSKGDILIRKIDADTGVTLSGATLAILDGSTEIERWVSGVSAHVVEKQLTAGKTYTLHEVSAPAGYELAPDQTFTVPADGKEITVTMSDRRIIGTVRLVKRDATTRETLAGAQFELFNEAGTKIYATGTVGSYRVTNSTSNSIFETDSTGVLTVTDLPYGTYYFSEVKAPAGYALSSENLGFTILRSGTTVEVTYLDPKAVGSVRLRKVGSDGTRRLAGAVFELYAATPRSVGQAAASTLFSNAYYRYGTYRTNSDGELYVDNLPWDSYYFVEVDAPSGYEVNKDVNGDDIVYTFTISAASADATIDLGGIINTPTTPPPPPRETYTPTPTPIVERGGVVSGVLGVRAKPTSGVLGERIGPVTGDASNIILWLLLLTACVATIVATVVTGKKKKAAAK